MKTEVIVKRPFLGGEIEQKSKSGMFNATDLVGIVNRKRLNDGKAAMCAIIFSIGSN